ncbi:hypothetical protein ABH937_001943 [Kitasatospora sp. GAS1066B]
MTTQQRALTTAGTAYVTASDAGAVTAVYLPNEDRIRRRAQVLRQLAEGRRRRQARGLR